MLPTSPASLSYVSGAAWGWVGATVNLTSVVGAQIGQIISGTGGAGSTLSVSNNTVVGSQTINALAGGIETKWYCASPALPGGVCKITSWPTG